VAHRHARLTCDARTQTYVARRTAEGMSKREIIRCLKRYVAREVFHALLDKAKEHQSCTLGWATVSFLGPLKLRSAWIARSPPTALERHRTVA
jgi:hypothetical protein